MIKRIALILAALWLAAPAYAQAPTRLCFPTNTLSPSIGRTSCQDVTSTNPLPVNASVTLTATALNVTVTNTTAAPVFVSSSTGFGGSISGTLTVQNLGAGSLLNVLDTNSAAILAGVTAAVPTGTNNIGTVVAGQSLQIAMTPTISTSGAYAAGNCVGGFNAVTVANLNGQSGFITGWRGILSSTSASGITPTMTVYMFDTAPATSTCTDKGTFLLLDADLDKLIMVPTSVTFAAPAGMTQTNAEIAFTPPRPFIAGGSTGSGVKTIFIGIESGSAFTATSTTGLHTRTGSALN